LQRWFGGSAALLCVFGGNLAVLQQIVFSVR